MSEYPVPEDLKAECVLCKGRGRVSSTSFVRPGTYIERQCHNCKGRGWNWALTFDEMAERISKLEAQLAEAKAGWDSCIADLRKAAEICRETEAELAAANERAERLSRPVNGDTEFIKAERVKSRLLGMEDAISAFSNESLMAENEALIDAIDQEMVSCHLGVFNPGDDPRKAINLLMCWAQSLGEYNALRPVDEDDKNAWLKTPMMSSPALTHRSERDANAILANRRAQQPSADEKPQRGVKAMGSSCVCGHQHRSDGSCTVCVSCTSTPCNHERLNEDGICRLCGTDCRGIG